MTTGIHYLVNGEIPLAGVNLDETDLNPKEPSVYEDPLFDPAICSYSIKEFRTLKPVDKRKSN